MVCDFAITRGDVGSSNLSCILCNILLKTVRIQPSVISSCNIEHIAMSQSDDEARDDGKLDTKDEQGQQGSSFGHLLRKWTTSVCYIELQKNACGRQQ